MKKTRSYSTLVRQLKLIKTYHKSRMYFIMFLNMIAGGILPVIAIYLPRYVINIMGNSNDTSEVFKYIAIMCGVSAILAIIISFCNYFQTNDFMAIRMNEFYNVAQKFQQVDYKYMEDPKFKDYTEISTEALSGDGQGFQGAYHDFFKLLPLILSAILYCVIISLFNPLITLACILSAIITIMVNKKIAKHYDKNKDKRAHAYRQKKYFYDISYDFAYGKEIRVYDLEDKVAKDYKHKSLSYIKVIKDFENKKFGLGMFELLLLLVQDSLAYFLVIYAYFKNGLSIGDVTLYIGAIIALSTTIRSITDLYETFMTDLNYSKSYFEYIDNESLYSSTGTLKAFDPQETLEIEFKNVSFKYPNTDNYVLSNFNFKIKKGQKLAIVGTNGAGKSTIVKLITGLFDVNEGQILLNGIDIKQFEKTELNKMFSVVFQDINIYACSIIENVIGDEESRKADGIDCLNRVGLKDKIAQLNRKYDQPLLKILEDDGMELSGGQNQKICIARALYKDANMVILDEPTSALDALAEAEIYQSFDDLVKNKTAIYISHRLSSTKFCDKIALFSKDGLIEYGSHEELMNKKGEYFKMFEIQGKYYKEGVKEDE